MNTLKTLLPSIIPVLVLIASAIAPQVQGLISAHPIVASLLAAAGAILNHWLPSPAK